ncbi:MAG TPA: PKD domain-containing protein, partial [Terriglobales bacterium]|nr:PKD domain-containing protein [Terriglobales bacterium]
LVASLRILPPPPVADAGKDQRVTHLSAVKLDGAGSSAGDGTTLAYSWVQTAGSPVEIVGANTASPTFKAPPIPFQDLRFTLTVTDRFGFTASDEVVVTITPGRPGG